MAHGQPDFGQFTGKLTTYALSDMAELAARQKSIDTFDRRGDVVWLDDFEDNINKWVRTPVGVGSSITLSNLAARNGARSVEMVTGNLANNSATITKILPVPVLGKVGFELSFTVDLDLNSQRFRIDYYDGALLHSATVYYNPTNLTLYYIDNAGAPRVLAVLQLYDAIEMFNTLKLVADFSTNRYVRLILNEVTYDLSNYTLNTQVFAAVPVLQVSYFVRTNVAANQTLYADDAIVTQNEP